MTPALQARQARQHRGAGHVQLARQVGRAGARVGLQQGDQAAVEGVQNHGGMTAFVIVPVRDIGRTAR